MICRGILRIVILLVTVSTHALSDDLRCLCNLPECSLLGNLCRTASYSSNDTAPDSQSKYCFFQSTLLSARTQQWSPRLYGCTNVDPTHSHCDHRLHIDSKADLIHLLQSRSREDTTSDVSVTICCATHMCNHDDYVRLLLEHLRPNLIPSTASQVALGNKIITESPRILPHHPPNSIHIYQEHNDDSHEIVVDRRIRIALLVVPLLGLCSIIGLIIISIHLLKQNPNNDISFIAVPVKSSPTRRTILCCVRSSANSPDAAKCHSTPKEVSPQYSQCAQSPFMV